MNNVKKYICFLVLGCVLCTHVYNVYQACYASELVVAGGLASAGTALLGLLAMSGVGMELENNRKFNELSEEEKTRIETGLVQNYEDVALQRGASLEKIKTWTNDLCNGVLDKASECWGIFKDWAKNITLTSANWETPDIGAYVSINSLLGISLTNNYGTFTIDGELINSIKNSGFDTDSVYCWIVENLGSSSTNCYRIIAVTNQPTNNSYNLNNMRGTSFVITSSNTLYDYYPNSSFWYSSKFVAIRSSYPTMYNGVDLNGLGSGVSTFFKTNTDYLERLKGQEEDVIDVIDVTDIKNPIVESRGNSIANISWNRGTRRTDNNNDDDDKMVTGLVPMDVWYEAIDDEQEEMKDAVVVYDNYIEQHPDEQGKYFITTTPITNIHNYYNTLPVVNIPATGTVVNNYYEYNNYNNHNVTIYQEPYNAGIIPTFPDFSKKFPFCIPFDLYEFFAVFLAEKEAPKIDIPFPVLDNTQHQLSVEYITIDLAPYEYVSDVLRVMLFIAFCVGLMLLTRHLIKG